LGSRFRLIVQYDGSNYFGFQRQKGLPTIQGELEEALSILLREEVRVKGASRTDRGVHALGQVVAFDSSQNDLSDSFLYHLNALLPGDIRVIKIEKTGFSFRPRQEAIKRHYSYFIYNFPYPSPFLKRFTYHCPWKLNLEEVEKAASLFLGEHNFKFFTTSEEKRSTIRSIEEIRICLQGSLVEIKFSGRSFLHNMLRMIGAALIEVGRGKISREEIVLYLSQEKRPGFAPLPSRGLFLVKIDYPDRFTDGVFPEKDTPFPSALLS